MGAPLTTRFARNGDVSIAFQVLGDGPTELVFIQGFCSHLDLLWGDPAYAHAMGRLASFGRVVLYDKRGTGLSDRFSVPASLDDSLGDLRAVIDASGAKTPVLIGFSAGGALAALYAATYPREVAGLVLCEAMPRMAPGPGYLEDIADEANALIARFRTMAGQWGTGMLMEFFGPSLAGGALQRRAVGIFERACATPGALEALLEEGLATDVTSILPTIRVPTLVMHRRDDVVPIAAGRYFADNIPGARFVELEGGDHMPWAGNFSPVATEIERFVRGDAAGTDTDRSLASLVFTSMVDADSRAAALGDTQFGQLLARHDRALRSELERFGGREVKHTGDGVFAAFDGATAAARFALAAVEAAATEGIAIRAGVHTGEVRVVSGQLGGASAHIAARVTAEAEPGGVLATQTVRDLATTVGLTFDSIGSRELRGVPGSWELYAVSGTADVESTRVDPFGDLSRSERMMLRSTVRSPRAARVMSRVIRALA